MMRCSLESCGGCLSRSRVSRVEAAAVAGRLMSSALARFVMRTGELVVERPGEEMGAASLHYDPLVDVPLTRAKTQSVLALPAVHLQTLEQQAVIQVLYNTPAGNDREHRERQTRQLAAAAAQHIAICLQNFEQLTQSLEREPTSLGGDLSGAKVPRSYTAPGVVAGNDEHDMPPRKAGFGALRIDISSPIT